MKLAGFGLGRFRAEFRQISLDKAIYTTKRLADIDKVQLQFYAFVRLPTEFRVGLRGRATN